MKILVLNAGSSSQKSCLYNLTGDALPDEAPQPLWEAHIDWIGKSSAATLQVQHPSGVLKTELPIESRSEAIDKMLHTLWSEDTGVIAQPSEIDLVGHRVVHGGEYRQSTFVTPEVKAAIANLSVLAPAHNPASLEGIEASERILGSVTQFADVIESLIV